MAKRNVCAICSVEKRCCEIQAVEVWRCEVECAGIIVGEVGMDYELPFEMELGLANMGNKFFSISHKRNSKHFDISYLDY